MRFSTLEEWLAWQESLHPKKIDLGLDRVRLVLSRMGLRYPAFRIITVAGTNGKGSSVALLAGILSAAGYRVGTFTSPHLHHYRERIGVCGRHPTDKRLMELFDYVDRIRSEVSLTYFEFGALSAIAEFHAKKVHVAVLEVGLGGRLDAVNALDADAAMVVSVGLDHIKWLGTDRETIAFEKAGVFRPGRPAIVSEPGAANSLLKHAAELGSDLRVAGRDFRHEQTKDGWRFQSAGGSVVEFPKPAMRGEFQYQNAAGVVALLEAVRDKLPVPKHCIDTGLQRWSVPGRLQQFVLDGVEWLFDVTHNGHGARALAEFLRTSGAKPTTAVVGLMADKDHQAIFSALASCFERWIVVTPPSGRSATSAELERALKDVQVETVELGGDPVSGCQLARRLVASGDRIVVFGSFQVVGPALKSLELYSPSSH